MEKDKKDKDKVNKRLSPDEDTRDNKKKKRSKSPSNSPAYSKWSSHSIRQGILLFLFECGVSFLFFISEVTV